MSFIVLNYENNIQKSGLCVRMFTFAPNLISMASKRTLSKYYINELEESDKPTYEKKLMLNNRFLLPDYYSFDATQWSSEESFYLT